MIKLALVGKSIQHSKSPEIYRNLLNEKVEYDLLDYSDSTLIPKASDLFKNYMGINITSPYKLHFLNQVVLSPIAFRVQAINCMKLHQGKIIGENTDFMAVKSILEKYKDSYSNLEIIILGDGVMSKVTTLALDDLTMSYKVLSRKLMEGFDRINLCDFTSTVKQVLIINTCSREYVYHGPLPVEALFWDYNYAFIPHSSLFLDKIKSYKDGLEMLELQAQYALTFWSINPSSLNY
jgi:shikimate dehydrogenase